MIPHITTRDQVSQVTGNPVIYDEPHHAVSCRVLNLPSQVWALPDQSALAQAYRVMGERLGP